MNQVNNRVAVLVVNAGSSSLKLSLFVKTENEKGAPTSAEPDWKVLIDGRGKDAKVKIQSKAVQEESTIDASDETAVAGLLEKIWSGSNAVLSSKSEIAFVGHRVVHGGQKYSGPVQVDESVLQDLSKLIELAPEHEGANIKAIHLAQRLLPESKHIAVFDTAFHHDMPLCSQVYAGPYSWYEKLGIRRYGFHGINHQYCAQRALHYAAQKNSARVISCHLGSGASLCASLGGKSRMTTMGYTPLEGLVMRTRTGSIDSGIIFHLLHEKLYSKDELLRILNEESGLKGLSGMSGDMRDLEKAIAEKNERAQLAFDVFMQNLAAHVAGLATTIGGIDFLVFSGGIGENSALVREECCKRLQFMGVDLDNDKNNDSNKTERLVSSANSALSILIVPAREDLAVANECLAHF
jgi:acetate kinase